MNTILSSILLSISSAWKASPKYTFMRTLFAIFSSISPLFMLKITREMYNNLVLVSQKPSLHSYILFLAIASFLISSFMKLFGKIITHIQIIHNEQIEKHIQTMIMEKSMNIDISFFDTPESINSIKNASANASIVANHTWNALSLFSFCISFLFSFVSLGFQCIWFSFVITLVSIPSAHYYHNLTKKLFTSKIDNTSKEREKWYLHSITSNRHVAQEIRLFNIKNHLLNKYSEIYDSLINQKNIP